MNEEALNVATALCLPSSGVGVTSRAMGSPDMERVIGILRANKVPMAHLAPGAGPWSDSEAWARARAEESAALEALGFELDRVAALLGRRGIEGVLFKSPGGLPYRSSNVDLLVRPRAMNAAARLLEENGHLLLPHYREDHKLLFRFFRAGRSALCVHLHDAVSWGRVRILDGDGVVDRSRTGAAGPWRYAAFPDLIQITLAHALYETDQLRLSDLRALRAASAGSALSWADAMAGVERRGWELGFHSILLIASALEEKLTGTASAPPELRARAGEAIRDRGWARRYVESTLRRIDAGPLTAMPWPISKLWSKAHFLERLAHQSDRSPDERIADVAATIRDLSANRLRLRCRPAVLISLSGLDGSGKSTVIAAARDAMTLCEVPVKVVWSRGGFSTWMQALKSTARSVAGHRIPSASQSERKFQWLARPGVGRLFVLSILIEQALHYALRVRLPRRVGWSILCDRYVFDTAADLEAKLGARRSSGPGGAALSWLAPRPDLALLLHADAELAAGRKPGEAPGWILARQSAALERLARSHRLVVVDADRPREEVVDEAVRRVLAAAFGRFRRADAAGAAGPEGAAAPGSLHAAPQEPIRVPRP